MKVTAIKPAFIDGSLVQVGQKLEVPDGTKGSWFVPVESVEANAAKANAAKAKAASQKTKDTPKALSELTGEKAKGFTEVHGAKNPHEAPGASLA